MKLILEKIGNTNIPIKVPIRTESYSTMDSCFYNVQDKISKDGGQIVFGWKLHQSNILQEAERHAVWKSTSNELVDITPDQENSEFIIFLEEDGDWKYNGEFTDNIRVNITNNPLVDDFILLCETVTKFWQTGSRKSRMQIQISEPAYQLIQMFEVDKAARLSFINQGNTVEDNCYCGSSLKYKNCHGLDLEMLYADLLNKLT